MKKYQLIIVLIILLSNVISCNSNTETKNENDKIESKNLKPLIELFNEPGNQISDETLVKYFEINNNNQSSDEFKTVKKVDFKNDILGFIYKIDCRAGGQCEIINMALFKSGVKTDEIRIGQNFADYGGSIILEHHIKGNRIELTKTVLENEWSVNGDLKEIKNTEQEIFIVNANNGKFEKE
ncbi:hypothetical protein [Psychroflexus montanilacus]|uniref:hypothetical protein n=1 Tax=Psychroflexus montanilacus TaxID=2873598 RepID=UPI001CC93034|nr:hypothetical protein [Psychroflexus montanilacus]MBZ9651589.1 hypothetical protein [Psychroflexus montanilacus]